MIQIKEQSWSIDVKNFTAMAQLKFNSDDDDLFCSVKFASFPL